MSGKKPMTTLLDPCSEQIVIMASYNFCISSLKFRNGNGNMDESQLLTKLDNCSQFILLSNLKQSQNNNNCWSDEPPMDEIM